jgi:hypothetical protein
MIEEYPFEEISSKIRRRELVLWILEIIQIITVCLVFVDKLWILLPFLLQTAIIVVLAKMLLRTEMAYIQTVDFIVEQQKQIERELNERNRNRIT